jgi:hypothetical protein
MGMEELHKNYYGPMGSFLLPWATLLGTRI